jgi:hypothetical protein
VSLIGSIEQFALAGVLRRLETHAKTGLLVIQQGSRWVELYFREGQLMCVGPVRTNANLGERLLQDGIISQQALQEALLAVGADGQDEVSIAITLINLGHTTKEKLRAWSMQKTLPVLQAILVWTSGDIYFEEGTPTPPGRLLAAFSIESLLAMILQQETPSITLPATRAASYQPGQAVKDASPATPTPPMPDITRFKTLMGASYSPSQGDSPAPTPIPESPAADETQVASLSAASLLDPDAFIPRSSQTRDLDSQPLSFQASEAVAQSFSTQSLLDDGVLPSSFVAQASPVDLSSSAEADDGGTFASIFGGAAASDSVGFDQPANAVSFVPPQPISIPVPARYVDTSYMRPDMILMPLDLSALHTQNALVALTPEQWRVLTVVDGRTSLQEACRDLAMTPDLLCQAVGELVADQLIRLVPPSAVQTREVAPASPDVMTPGPGNNYAAPGYAASPAQPWTASGPLTPDIASQFPSAISFEARSQWGNGGNGASFVPGRGWVAPPQPLQPLSPSNPSLVNAASYAQMGGGR